MVGNVARPLAMTTKHLLYKNPDRPVLLMRIINSHTSKILEAVIVGDFNTVIKKSNEVAKAGNAIMRMFFPEGKKVDQWFEEVGKDPDDP